jgi:HD superfamily phosphohydrolase
MHLAGEATNVLLAKHKDIIRGAAGWSESEFEERREGMFLMARLAGLLHDVGHAPFSHVGEHGLLEGTLRHEDYSAAIIATTEIGEQIDESLADRGITRGDVVGLLRGGIVPAA